MDIGEEIISGCKNFRKEAQEALYKFYAPKLKGICLRYSNQKAEADEVLHEGFMKIFMRIEKYKGEGSFEGWMKKIMINTAINHFNKNKAYQLKFQLNNDDFPENKDETESPDDDSHNNVIENADLSKEEILEAVKSLPDGYRIIFNLYVIEGLKHREIAQLLNINEGTSKSQLVRSRKMLQKKLYELALSKNKKY